jgi:uncharacterized protein (DUF1697 family)
MPAFVAMLRGVNVGGRAKVPMADLRELLTGLGYRRVRTYLQSGNVVLDHRGTGAAVASGVAAAVADRFGLDVPVVVRSAGDLARVVGANPYPAEGLDPDEEPNRFHVTFLAGDPDPAAVDALVAKTDPYAPDTLRVVGPDVFLHVPGGYGESKLTNSLIERTLGVRATTRNWRTVTTLAAMAAG